MWKYLSIFNANFIKIAQICAVISKALGLYYFFTFIASRKQKVKLKIQACELQI